MSRQIPVDRQIAAPKPVKSDLGFPVVGIGASAGGVEALQAFFGNAPTDMEMAFVVIIHLRPTDLVPGSKNRMAHIRVPRAGIFRCSARHAVA
nr:chemotaxis protein CheB [Paraburkholderia hospita]